ncbi:nucleolar protein 14 [Pogonomyrmex barbatus]|uniref:Nucleolar protein 14 n=1 Tax=Pogonomyrmex barbatus TaxID=144034 RepID=A0A6I9WM06_9HYME|nr:nucleolar protein 14 [Pogonomyrmex barbatus]
MQSYKMNKAKKNSLAEPMQQKNKKQLNPFEIHINRNKQKVLGQKSKNDCGLPGVSRAKAINKRKKSLLQEYKLQNKDNIFLDKRIGEKNYAMSTEEKTLARFATERIKAYKKKSIFNLNDEILTHRGQTLEEIEKFDDPRSDDEFSDNEDVSGKLDKNFIEKAHFGGGILSRTDFTLTRKDLIDQLIAESKKRKAEKQKIREQTIDLTEKLDSEWRDLLPIMSASKMSIEDIETMKTDTYDIAVQQLKFEARGNPSEKLKSEEKIIQEEKEKLERLEANRLIRMKGFICDISNQYKHKSADDLEDGFMMEIIKDNDAPGLIDNINDNDQVENNKQEKNKLGNSVIKKIIENEQTGKKDSKNKKKIYSELSDAENKSNSDNKDSEIENSNHEESKDNFSDLKIFGSSIEDESKVYIERENEKYGTFNNVTNIKHTSQSDKIRKLILKQNDNIQNSSDQGKQQIRHDFLNQKEHTKMIQKALPCIYNAPESFQELKKLLEPYSVDYQSMIVDRIIKCNHWTSDSKNKEKLSNLFLYLLQYINNCATTENANDLIKCFQIFDRLCPYLYDLAHMNPTNAKTCLQEVIKEKYYKFEKNKTEYPGVDTLIFFKLISLLFPTSDFRHPVVTPCLIFMSQIIMKAHIKKYRSDISKGLFICTLILEYTLLSKRFAPSVINFLHGIIYIATPANLTQNVKVIPPFKAVCKVLIMNKINSYNTIKPNGAHMFITDLIHEELDDEFKVKALLTAVNLLTEFKNQFQELEAIYSIFEHILQLLKINKFKQYSLNVKNHIKELYKELELLQTKKLEYMVLEKKRPKPLRTYEPKIITVYDGKQHKSMLKEKAEREKLLHKYKREFKGAVREIKRDRDFLVKVQIAKQIKNDAERKRKVNEIFREAAIQQNEFKKIKKK